jgi:ribosome-associated translation inhibitor RaiA
VCDVELAEQKRKFILYEYLLYFWKRKWLFVIVPLITTILIASAIYVLKSNNQYTGTSIVFTGSINARELTDPNNIEAKYNKMIKGLDVFVTEKGLVKITVNGDSEDAVKNNLKMITKAYNNDLHENAEKRLDSSDDLATSLEKRAKALEKSISLYKKKLEDEELAQYQSDNLEGILIISEDELTSSLERANKIRGDILLFERPKVYSEPKVNPAKTYLPQSIAIGIVLGLVLTVALLMLLKYLGDARKYYKVD